jgi:hypothetical protein
MEYKAPNLEEQATRKLEAPPIEYGAPKQREPDECRSSVNTRSARRSAIIKVLPIQRQHLAKDGEGAPYKTCTSISVRCFIIYNLATDANLHLNSQRDQDYGI